MITVGIDEVGRGCWAGPLVAGAVALPETYVLADGVRLSDSKKLTKRQRDLTSFWIQDHALAVGLGWVTPAEVDSLGLTEAVRTAMRRAVKQLEITYDEIIIDGNVNYLTDNLKSHELIKADDSVPSVSAASIVAKVARDNYMATLDERYTPYGFASHVGYGTAAHLAALRKHGVSDLHRLSYKPVALFL